jgi:hypothetical protein
MGAFQYRTSGGCGNGISAFHCLLRRSPRGYLQQLSSDFNGICQAIKLVIVTSKVDQTDLARVVFREQFRFAVNMMQVELRLLLYGFGWSGVEAGNVVYCFDTMRSQLQYLMVVSQPSAA